MNKCCYNCKSINVDYLFSTCDYISNDKFEILKCKNCHLIFPYQYPENLDKYYPNTYRSYLPIVEKLLNLKSKFYVKKIISNHKNNKSKKILEIGCGSGKMLEIFKKSGWEVYGSERSVALEVKNNLNISDKNINQYPNNYFDLILLYNSFEHLNNPKKVLTTLSDKIKKNGTIIIAVPTADSLQFKFGKKDWIHLDAPRHLNIFSLKAFKKMESQNHNLKIISRKSTSIDLEFYGWFATIVNKFSTKNNLFHSYLMSINRNKSIFFIGLLQLILFSLPCFLLTIWCMLFNKGAITEIIFKKIKDN